ncbi:hypothetical protein MCB86_03010 [Pseudomonas sp. KSR10]|jgi:hypothetical protein|uniref:Uncharacterized protein n=1 Tax=Stutzerimonas stutzeri TaxID=316 RepID=A0A0D9AL92_STUST|nr:MULTISPECIES: hypothetical protein [Pseudomonadaceae]KJH81507.1 hypothetical protein UF78_13200 [Stutzerimonas stutzeri]MCG6539044.1 hypothetical protein [Pseudomonas sp. KSR10]
MQVESMMFTEVQAANDPDAQAPLPGDPDGASINDAPMSDPEEPELTDEDIDMFEDDPTIPTE